MVSYKINFDKYFPQDIIKLIEDGVVTLDEVIESGVAFRCFSSVLYVYIHERSKEIKEKVENTETVITRQDGVVVIDLSEVPDLEVA